MQDPIEWLFSTSGYMPHGHCYLWQPVTLWLNVGSDGVIAGAYYAIPVALYHLVRERRSEIPYPRVLLMFASFILLCGTTHLMEIWTVWHPEYRIAGAIKALTGVVSVATMLLLFQIMPQVMQLRGPRQLQLEVQARTAELANVNATLRAQITARDLAEQRLREQDQRKDEFLATLAHELRNPLAPIRHAVKLLSAAQSSAEQQRWGRDVIERQARRMALLLDDLLDVSRITRGRLELKRDHVDLWELLGTAVETVRPVIEEKAHVLTLIQPDPPIRIFADPLRLSQAISNLLTNAAKYTPRGGRIALSVARGDGLAITVSDTGVGFEPAAASGLFEMFSQADTGIAGAEAGLGIGLALVKGLVQLHGGNVRAHSRGPGFGSEFTITLPPTTVSVTAASGMPAPDPLPVGAPELRTRILIADDNRDAADAMGMVLELSGHEVIVAHSGSQALALGRQHRPEVVILDIGMPDMSGYDVARTARSESWGREAFLLALTGWGQPGDKERARLAGFNRHLTKPVDPEVVEQLLNSHLSKKPA